MSATLARKLRRIGLTRIVSSTSERTVTVDEQGRETEGTITKDTSHRHRIQYSPEELTQKRAEIIAAWRAKRKRQK